MAKKGLLISILFFCTAIGAGLNLQADSGTMDYRDWEEGRMHLAQLAESGQLSTVRIGPSSYPGVDQYAVKISELGATEDDGQKNAILFECGMHAREWFAAESCYRLIDYLVLNRQNTPIRNLLSQVDVWVIPQSNPGGRMIDDLAYGDPNQFIRMCRTGRAAGEACASHAECPSSRCYRRGWRPNANRDACPTGVDIARNFSAGWNKAGGVTCESKFQRYRGPAPFSELEALNLRRFVHNHMISMAVVVHGPDQKLHNLWYQSHLPSKFMTDVLVTKSLAAARRHQFCNDGVGTACANDAECQREARCTLSPAMPRIRVGEGSGQFSAWLAQTSDVAREFDAGTKRGISTFFFELPVHKDFYAPPFQEIAFDTSTHYHPSNALMVDIWEDMVRELFMYLINQTRSPQCPTDETGNFLHQVCLRHDFGLVGAKIGQAPHQPGLLDYNLETREEQLPAGTHRLTYAIQNFGTSVEFMRVDVSIVKDGAALTSQSMPVTLRLGERTVLYVEHDFVGGATYQVAIRLSQDDFFDNNEKIFAFRVIESDTQLPSDVPAPSHLRVWRAGEPEPKNSMQSSG